VLNFYNGCNLQGQNSDVNPPLHLAAICGVGR